MQVDQSKTMYWLAIYFLSLMISDKNKTSGGVVFQEFVLYTFFFFFLGKWTETEIQAAYWNALQPNN